MNKITRVNYNHSNGSIHWNIADSKNHIRIIQFGTNSLDFFKACLKNNMTINQIEGVMQSLGLNILDWQIVAIINRYNIDIPQHLL